MKYLLLALSLLFTIPADAAALYKVLGTGAGGIYFNKPDGTLGATVVSSKFVTGLAVGEKLMMKADTTVSLLQNLSVPYYGWGYNTFTASQLYMTRAAPAHFFDFANAIPITPQNGADINPGGPGDNMSPYYHHNRNGMHEIIAGQEGDWYFVFVVWASCGNATGNSIAKNEYLWVITQQTEFSIMRFTN